MAAKKLKVLLTGVTKLMVGDKMSKTTTYVSFVPILKQLLENMDDVEVDQRVVEAGEDLADYDVALIGLAPTTGYSGMAHRWSAFWVASQLPHVTFVDDWQVGGILGSIKDESGIWKTAMLGKKSLAERESFLPFKDEIEKVREHWSRDGLDVTLAPLFYWGDMQKFKEKALKTRILLPLDPSALTPTYATPGSISPGEKERAWAYAGLKDWQSFFNKKSVQPEWPVKTIMPEKGKRGNWGRVTEEEVVRELYLPNWGQVVVPYPRKMRSTGWWRSRYNFAGQANNVLWISPDDLGELNPKLFPATLRTVEKHTTSELTDLYSAQQKELHRYHPSAHDISRNLRVFLTQTMEPIR